MKSGIYCIENLVNGKKYIGQTRNINIRKGTHYSLLKNKKHFNTYLQKSWDKYGKENFLFYIIEKCPVKSLGEKEKYYIEKFESLSTQKGYNLDKGGFGSSYNKGKPLSEETKDKLSKSKKGKFLGEENPFFGKNTPKNLEVQFQRKEKIGIINYLRMKKRKLQKD